MECCTALISSATVATHKHPDTEQWICTGAARAIVTGAILKDDFQRMDRLMKHFHFKSNLILRAENAFYYTMALSCKGLRDNSFFKIFLDMPASVVNGKGKLFKAPRADFLHIHGEGPNSIALLGEFDENDDHDDEWERFERICKYANISIDRVYIYRIHARMNTNQSIVSRKTHNRNDFYVVNERGSKLLDDIVEYLDDIISRIRQGIPPNLNEPRVTYFNRKE